MSFTPLSSRCFLLASWTLWFIGATACGGDKASSDTADSGESLSGTTSTGGSSVTTDADREAFCLEVFGPDDVEPILHIDELAATDSGIPGTDGFALCDLGEFLSKVGDYRLHESRASLWVECRPGASATDVDLARLLAAEVSNKKGSYQDIDMGMGGGYGIALGGGFLLPRHNIHYVHATVPCRVDVSTYTLEEDYIWALAEHVDQALTMDNYPAEE